MLVWRRGEGRSRSDGNSMVNEGAEQNMLLSLSLSL